MKNIILIFYYKIYPFLFINKYYYGSLLSTGLFCVITCNLIPDQTTEIVKLSCLIGLCIHGLLFQYVLGSSREGLIVI